MEVTLDQLGVLLVQASKRVPNDPYTFQKLMAALHTPVGGLKIRRRN